MSFLEALQERILDQADRRLSGQLHMLCAQLAHDPCIGLARTLYIRYFWQGNLQVYGH